VTVLVRISCRKCDTRLCTLNCEEGEYTWWWYTRELQPKRDPEAEAAGPVRIGPPHEGGWMIQSRVAAEPLAAWEEGRAIPESYGRHPRELVARYGEHPSFVYEPECPTCRESWTFRLAPPLLAALARAEQRGKPTTFPIGEAP
jgi:hypothetical protein